MPGIKLTYFDGKGRAEAIRYILSYMGKEFEDVRLTRDQWPSIKSTTPYGKVPIIEIDGKVFHQTAAICRYLAVEAGLSGGTPLENIEIDQIVESFEDFVKEFSKIRTADPAEQEKVKQTFITETVPFYFGKFEHGIKNGGYLANGKLSWADLYVVALCEMLAGFLGKADLFEHFPHMKALAEKVRSNSGIKEWIKKRPVTSF